MHGGVDARLGRCILLWLGWHVFYPDTVCIYVPGTDYGQVLVELHCALAPKGFGLCGCICGENIPRVAFLGDTRPARDKITTGEGKSFDVKVRTAQTYDE